MFNVNCLYALLCILTGGGERPLLIYTIQYTCLLRCVHVYECVCMGVYVYVWEASVNSGNPRTFKMLGSQNKQGGQ